MPPEAIHGDPHAVTCFSTVSSSLRACDAAMQAIDGRSQISALWVALLWHTTDGVRTTNSAKAGDQA